MELLGLVKMFPNINPKQMQKMMNKMGMKQEEIPASEVIIKGPKEIIIKNPHVVKINMMGQETYQVVGTPVEQSLETKPEINDEDVQAVVDQTGSSGEEARKTIEECEGDLAEAILKLKDIEQ